MNLLKDRFRLKYGLILLIIILSTPPHSSAEIMGSSEIRIETDFLNQQHIIVPEEGVTPNGVKPDQNVQDEATQKKAKTISSPTNAEYSFGLSAPWISYGQITPGEPILRTVQFYLDAYSPTGYGVYIYQNSLLETPSKQSIPTTRCDNGSCSPHQAAPWVSPLTFGMGFRCEEASYQLCDEDFREENNYKSLPIGVYNASPILHSITAKRSVKGELTFKVNVPGTYMPGKYSHTVTLLILPQL